MQAQTSGNIISTVCTRYVATNLITITLVVHIMRIIRVGGQGFGPPRLKIYRVPLNIYKAVKLGPLWTCQLNAIKWRFAGGQMKARFKWNVDPLSPHLIN